MFSGAILAGKDNLEDTTFSDSNKAASENANIFDNSPNSTDSSSLKDSFSSNSTHNSTNPINPSTQTTSTTPSTSSTSSTLDSKYSDKQIPDATEINISNEEILNSLIFEFVPNASLPKNLRTGYSYKKKLDSTDILKFNDIPDFTGLEDLDAAASGQFTEKTLQNVVNYINEEQKQIRSEKALKTKTADNTLGTAALNALDNTADKTASNPAAMLKKIIVVDLRKEFHIYINGIPVTFYHSRYNTFNWNKTPEEILNKEKELVSSLKQKKEIKVHRLKKYKDHVEYIKPEILTINTVETEVELVSKYNIEHAHFYVRDFRRPDDTQIDAFVSFVKSLSDDTFLYFHCRGGRGRTTTFMTLYDIIKNSDKVGLDDIIQRQKFIGGALLSELPIQKPHKHKVYMERLEFINMFYEYVVDPSGFQEKNWSSWLRLRNY